MVSLITALHLCALRTYSGDLVVRLMGGAGGRIEAGLVGASGALSLFYLVVDFQNHTFGAVFAERFLVSAPHDGEGVQNVVSILMRDAIEVEESRIKFAPEQESTLLVPLKRRTVVADAESKRCKAKTGIRQLECS